MYLIKDSVKTLTVFISLTPYPPWKCGFTFCSVFFSSIAFVLSVSLFLWSLPKQNWALCIFFVQSVIKYHLSLPCPGVFILERHYKGQCNYFLLLRAKGCFQKPKIKRALVHMRACFFYWSVNAKQAQGRSLKLTLWYSTNSNIQPTKIKYTHQAGESAWRNV